MVSHKIAKEDIISFNSPMRCIISFLSDPKIVFTKTR